MVAAAAGASHAGRDLIVGDGAHLARLLRHHHVGRERRQPLLVDVVERAARGEQIAHLRVDRAARRGAVDARPRERAAARSTPAG